MNTKIKALVVEDDLQIQEELKDVLGVLGHEHDWAESQQEAREKIENNAYHYVLADLEIPARPGRGFAKIEYGKQLIEQIQQIKGRGVIPVIVMTCHHKDGFNLTLELLGNGAMDFISKPFGDGTSGKSLPQVIQGVLDKHRRAFPPGVLPGDPPRPFQGGKLVFYPDHIELDGELILEHDCPGHAWDVIQALREVRPNGRRIRLNAAKLARIVDPTGQLSEGAINSCIHTLRASISQTMLTETNITVSRNDIIANKGKGYHLAERLIVENHDKSDHVTEAASHSPATSDAHAVASLSTNTTMSTTTNVTTRPPKPAAPLTERQHWILEQLRQDKKLTRVMLEQHFTIGPKQAKRELAGLSTRGLIEFVRKPRPGYYGIKSKATKQQ